MTTILFIGLFGGSLGPWEMFVILLVVLMLFGPDRLPELMRGMGRTAEKMRRTMDEVRYQILVAPEEEERRKKRGAMPEPGPTQSSESAPADAGGLSSPVVAPPAPDGKPVLPAPAARTTPPGAGGSDELDG